MPLHDLVLARRVLHLGVPLVDEVRIRRVSHGHEYRGARPRRARSSEPALDPPCRDAVAAPYDGRVIAFDDTSGPGIREVVVLVRARSDSWASVGVDAAGLDEKTARSAPPDTRMAGH
jgi:hypothetical protein